MCDKRQKGGFTLTEVLIVILVIAILAAVAIPMYNRTIERSKASDAIHVLDTVAARQEVMWVETGTYASDFAKLEAPVKGLTSIGSPKVGNFTYAMGQACAVADKGTYKIYKNYITQETGCTGDDCAILKGLVTEGTVGCDIIITYPDDSKPAPEANICDIDPAFCCKSGENWNGTACVVCASPKIWNSGTKNCICGNVCPGGAAPNPATCVCACSGKCSGGKVMTADCRCECPAETPNWNGEQCVVACTSPRTRWTGISCECPLKTPIYLSSSNRCIESCPQPKVWDGSDCICPASLSDYRNNCVYTGGTWNKNCGCDCAAPRTYLSGTSCVCPAPKTRYDGGACVCPQDREIYHAASNTCIAKCDAPLEWNFSALLCDCPASTYPLRTACRDSGGTWNDRTCICACPMPKQLNIASGACECFAPRTRWTGNSCECPFINPNWNATAATCNPPCNEPKNYWDGEKCACPVDKPKLVESLNLCCFNTQGNTCGGGIPNTQVGVMPCTSNTCVCPAGSKLTNSYCCASDYPNFINTSLGCCKTAAAGTACGGGIDNSAKTGKISCLNGLCESCSAGTLRNNYCCIGSCANGTYSGSGTGSCNCVCNTGFKFNPVTGNCDTCGAQTNFTWTDNKCNYTCNTGYCRDASGKCQPLAAGQWRNGENCQACTNKAPTNSAYISSGDTSNICQWQCNAGNCFNGSDCGGIPTGQWRNGNNCQACTNKPANSSYTSNGGTSNNCTYTGNGGYCASGSSYISIPIGQWRNGESCADCTNKHAFNTEYLSNGGTTNSCAWQCKSGYTSADGSCCLASAKPVVNQSCGACGYQTRTVTCINGNWTASAWSACADAPKPDTNQSCGTCGYQSRTVICNVSATNPSWSIGSWSACTESPKPAGNQSCGICGYQTRSVTCAPSATNPSWNASGWSICTESAKPATNQVCGTCGYQSRLVSCNTSATNPSWSIGGWSACNESAKPATNQICGTCGYQSRTVSCNSSAISPSWGVGGWSACNEASKPAVSAPCSGLAGDKTCGTAVRTPVCSASAISPSWSQPAWTTSACTAPIKGKESQACGYNNTGIQTRTCYPVCSGESCTAWSACSGQQCDPASKPSTTTTCAAVAGSNSCGNVIRDVSCTNGAWVAGGWDTSSCYAPSCNQAYFVNCTSLGYECVGTASRRCSSPSCSGGNYTPWDTSACYNKYQNQSTSTSCYNIPPAYAYRGTTTRTCTPSCGGGSCTDWDMSACEVMPCPDYCDYGYFRDYSIKWRKDGDCCKPAKRCSQEDCEANAPWGYIWTYAEFSTDTYGTSCCQDACELEHGKNTCACWSYAISPQNVCKCLGVGPYNFANSASVEDKCACEGYLYANKRECCQALGGSYSSYGDTCSATVYEWQIGYNEMWRNGYSCPDGSMISWVCDAVLTNPYYFGHPDVDNLPICGKYCSAGQLGSKCKYCEVTYTRQCPGYSSGGGPEAVKKTKTCVKSYKVL